MIEKSNIKPFSALYAYNYLMQKKAGNEVDRLGHTLYMLLNPPYALTFLKLASPYLSRKDFSEILASAWINCEAPHNDPELNKADLLFMFKSADPKALMEDDEYEQLQELDDTLTVYGTFTERP